MGLEIRRLSHALGAEVSGVDLRNRLDDHDFERVHDAFLEYCVLAFRGQALTREQHAAFSRRFGEPDNNERNTPERKAPGLPEILLTISRPKPNGDPATGYYNGQEWHTDRSHLPSPGMISLLRSIEIPTVGGDTQFCNMYRAYESLSDSMKKMLDGLYGVHMEGRSQLDLSTPERAAESRRRFPAAAHPIVRVHPKTGRKALYVNGQVRLFVGMTAEESKPLIDYLTDHSVRPQNVYRHRWQRNDLVMWDNLSTMHNAIGDYDRRQVRHMERTTIHGPVSGYAYDGPL